MKDRGTIVTNQLHWYHSFVIAMSDAVNPSRRKKLGHPLYNLIMLMHNDINNQVTNIIVVFLNLTKLLKVLKENKEARHCLFYRCIQIHT